MSDEVLVMDQDDIAWVKARRAADQQAEAEAEAAAVVEPIVSALNHQRDDQLTAADNTCNGSKNAINALFDRKLEVARAGGDPDTVTLNESGNIVEEPVQ